MNIKQFSTALTAILIMAFVCPIQTFAKDKYYLGHLYDGKMKKGAPAGFGTITIGDFAISGDFVENNTITGARFSKSGAEYMEIPFVFRGDVSFDESNVITLKKGGVIYYNCMVEEFNEYGKYQRQQKSHRYEHMTIEDDYQCSVDSLYPEYITIKYKEDREKRPFYGKNLFLEAQKRNDKYYITQEISIPHYDGLRSGNIPLQKRHFSVIYNEKKYVVDDFSPLENLLYYSIICEDGSTYNRHPIEGNFQFYFQYPDGDICTYFKIPGKSELGILKNPEGIYLLPDSLSNCPKLPSNSIGNDYSEINTFLNHNEKKPEYIVEIVAWDKFKNMPKEDIISKIEETIKKYPHKDTIAVFSTFDASESYNRWNGSVYHRTGSDDDTFNRNCYIGEYMNGKITTADEFIEAIAARKAAERALQDSLFEVACDKVRAKLRKKYKATDIEKCFHTDFENVPILLVHDFIDETQKVDGFVKYEIYSADPSIQSIIKYGRNIKACLVKKEFISIGLIIKNGIVIDQITGF